MSSEDLTNVKIVIIGQGGVGKTSLRRRYLGEKFRTNYIQTIGSDFSFKTIEIDNITLGLALWDIAGQERFSAIHPLFFKGAFGAVVVYSVVDRDSFGVVKGWTAQFMKISNRPNLPILVIGNKIDLIDQSSDHITEEEHNKLVSELKEEHPDHEFLSFRTSAMEGENVNEGFETFASSILSWIQKYSEKVRLSDYEKDIDKNFPGAYAIAMNQIVGPFILAGDPSIDYISPLTVRMTNSAIKLVASLDFDEVSKQSSIVSSFPWIEPSGKYYYIAFVFENEAARGSRELYILGINTNRELEDAINGLKGVLNGFLYSAMNEFAEIMQETKLDTITKEFRPENYPDEIGRFEQVLANLRQKMQKSLERWYNIPN